MLPVIFLGNLKSPDKQGPKRPYLSTNYTGTIFPNSVKMQIKYRLSPNLEAAAAAYWYMYCLPLGSRRLYIS